MIKYYKPVLKDIDEVMEVIEDARALLKEEGLDFVMMSGSGTTVFGFTKNKKLAEKLEEKYFKKGYQVELTKLLKA